MISKNTLRLLSVLLAIALLLPNLLVGGVSATEQIPEIPANMTRVVFVDSGATGTGDGSTPVNAFTSLEACIAAPSPMPAATTAAGAPVLCPAPRR